MLKGPARRPTLVCKQSGYQHKDHHSCTTLSTLKGRSSSSLGHRGKPPLSGIHGDSECHQSTTSKMQGSLIGMAASGLLNGSVEQGRIGTIHALQPHRYRHEALSTQGGDSDNTYNTDNRNRSIHVTSRYSKRCISQIWNTYQPGPPHIATARHLFGTHSNLAF